MLTRPTIALAVGVFAAALGASPVFAQHGGAGRGFAAPHGQTFTIRGGNGQGRDFGPGRRVFVGSPWFVPPYYPYDWYGEGTPPPPQPPVQVVYLTPPAPPPPPAAPLPPPQSLLLVNQDGQWVRVATGNEMPVGPLSSPPGGPPPAASSAKKGAAGSGPTANVQAPAQAVAPVKTILVFRDGHREEVDRYVIQGNTIYASSDYWRTGSWTTRIPMSQLDVPATISANQARGVKFALPTGPDEVVAGL